MTDLFPLRALALAGIVLLCSCGAGQQVLRTLPDLAHHLCVLTAVETPPAGLDAAEVLEDAARAYCDNEAVVRPFLEELTTAQAAGARRVGMVAAP